MKKRNDANKNTVPMPTGMDVSVIGIALSHVGRLGLLEKNYAEYGMDMSVVVKEQQRRVSFLSKSGKVTVFLPEDETGIASHRSNADKLFTFILCKIACEVFESNNYELRISFRLQELVDCGIFKTLKTARRGFNAIMHFLTGIRVSSSRKIIKSDIGDMNSVPFFDASIKNGVCYVCLNGNIEWDLMTKPFVNIPKEAFALSPQAFKVVKAIYRYVRVDRKSENFAMPLAYIVSKIGISVDPVHPGRTTDLLRKIVDEINDCKALNFSLILQLKDGVGFEDSIKHGALVVLLRGNLIKDMRRVEGKIAEKEFAKGYFSGEKGYFSGEKMTKKGTLVEKSIFCNSVISRGTAFAHPIIYINYRYIPLQL